MDAKFKFLEHDSVFDNSKSLQDSGFQSTMSATTHPSNYKHVETLLAKLNSGDKNFSRLPKRIDPSVVFSDDEDEDDDVKPIHDFRGNLDLVRPAPTTLPKTFSFSQNQKKLSSQSFYCSLEKDLNNRRNTTPKLKINVASVSGSANKSACTTESTELKASKIKTPVSMTKKNIEITETIQPCVSDPKITVNGKTYTLLDVLGSGGSCKVYSVLDTDKKSVVAIKMVNLQNVEQSVKEGYRKEIEYLQKLQESNRVIKMYDYEYQKNKLLLVLERGEIDLARFISNEAKLKQLSPIMIKFYWSQMLEAVADIHRYGIIHSDLKPGNFLLVSGHLKLIDFGIATSVPSDMTSTFRDTQVGTLNYMSPEAINGHSHTENEQALFKVGVKSDVWSLGCILYNLVYGITPFHNMKTMFQKIQAITDPKYEITFSPINDKALLDVMKSCLKRNPKERASIKDLLSHSYLNADKNATPVKSVPQAQTALKCVMEQMESLTPRRISFLSNVVQQLSKKPNS